MSWKKSFPLIAFGPCGWNSCKGDLELPSNPNWVKTKEYGAWKECHVNASGAYVKERESKCFKIWRKHPDCDCYRKEEVECTKKCYPDDDRKDCKSKWWTGPWSECSASCGEGQKTREVKCKGEKDEELPEAICKKKNGSKPKTTQKCFKTPNCPPNCVCFGCSQKCDPPPAVVSFLCCVSCAPSVILSFIERE